MKPPIKVVGDVKGKVSIIVDDMIDEASTFIEAARLLKSSGGHWASVLTVPDPLRQTLVLLFTNSFERPNCNYSIYTPSQN